MKRSGSGVEEGVRLGARADLAIYGILLACTLAVFWPVLGFEFIAPKRPPGKGGPSDKGGGRDDHDRPDSPSNGSGNKIPELVH